MNLSNVISGLVAGAVVALVAVLVIGVGRDGANGLPGLGAVVGPEFVNRIMFTSGMTEGGGYVFTATSTQAAATLTDRDLSNNKVISIATVDAPALALTLPASSTWTGLSKPYEVQEWIIDNLHTAAATTTTITAGVGVDIDGTGANDDVINGGVSGRLQCWRLLSSDIRCIVEEMVDAG